GDFFHWVILGLGAVRRGLKKGKRFEVVRQRPGSMRAGAVKTPSPASYCFPVAAAEQTGALRPGGDGKTNDAWLSQTVAAPGPHRTGALGWCSGRTESGNKIPHKPDTSAQRSQ